MPQKSGEYPKILLLRVRREKEGIHLGQPLLVAKGS